MQRQPTSAYASLVPADACAALPEANHIFLLETSRRSRRLDVANLDAGNVHRFYYLPAIISLIVTCIGIITELECGPMPNLMVALPNVRGALCSTPQSLADAHY